MITKIKNSFPRLETKTVRLWLSAVLALFILGSAQTLTAQEPKEQRVITTLIPWSMVATSPDTSPGLFMTKQPVLLRFRTGALPDNATVVSAKLRLVYSRRGDSNQVTIKSFFLASDPAGNSPSMDQSQLAALKPTTSFGDRTLGVSEPSTTQPWAEWQPTNVPLKAGATSFALLLQATDPNADERTWHSITAGESDKRPRLIVEYTVPGRTAVAVTEGPPATHSPKRFFPDPLAAAQFNSREVGSMWSYLPVSYNKLLYLITKNGSQYQLQAQPPLGGPPVWSANLADPGQHVVVSERGRLYIVGNQKILVYQLDPATEVTTAGGQPLSPKSVPDLNPAKAPAVGADASLYVVNKQAVYGFNPDLQELWKVTLDDIATSRITVGPSGQFVYLLGKKDTAVKLIAIDARTGEVSSAAVPTTKQLTTLHAPVVILHSDGTEKVYVAANSLDSGVFTAFDNQLTRPNRPRNAQLVATANWPPLTGQFTQPSAFRTVTNTGTTTATIYFVTVTSDQGQMTAIDWLKRSPQPVGTAFPVKASSLLDSANLVLDQGGNLFIWNARDAKLYAFGPGSPDFAPPSLTLQENSPLFFGSDGTLYAVDSSGENRKLRAIVPQFILADSSSGTITSPTHLTVGGTASKDTTLSAPGNIFLVNGFTVKQGSKLNVTQPKQ